MAHQTFFKSDMLARSAEKAKKSATALKTRRQVYKAVEARDWMKCRVCGVGLVRNGGLLPNALQHHHIHEGRKIESTAAIVLLCRECHDARHISRTLHIEGDANSHLRIWRHRGR